jgi:hypothetical protein
LKMFLDSSSSTKTLSSRNHFLCLFFNVSL